MKAPGRRGENRGRMYPPLAGPRPGKIHTRLCLLVNLDVSGSDGVTALVVLPGKLPSGMVLAPHHWGERIQKTVGSGEVILMQL
jgi:hypothetical protein